MRHLPSSHDPAVDPDDLNLPDTNDYGATLRHPFSGRYVKPLPKSPPLTGINARKKKAEFELLDVKLGMITLDLRPAMMRAQRINPIGPGKGKMNLQGFVRGTGINYQTAWRLLRNPERTKMVNFETLARICEYLQCQPGDLLRYVPRRALVPRAEGE